MDRGAVEAGDAAAALDNAVKGVRGREKMRTTALKTEQLRRMWMGRRLAWKSSESVAVVRSAPVIVLHASRWTVPSAFATQTVPVRRESAFADTGLYQTGSAYSMRGTTTVWNSWRM